MKIGHIPERLEQVLVPRYTPPPQLKPGGLTPFLPELRHHNEPSCLPVPAPGRASPRGWSRGWGPRGGRAVWWWWQQLACVLGEEAQTLRDPLMPN